MLLENLNHTLSVEIISCDALSALHGGTGNGAVTLCGLTATYVGDQVYMDAADID